MKQNQQNDKPKLRTITLKQFLRHFEEQRNRKFCFILGAGASKSSGIPTGAELASQWLNEIEEDLDEDEFEAWLKEERIDKNDPASFYHQIFARRFEIDHQAGYDFFEEIMEKAEPSCGYSFLAEILAQGKHNIVITTNFDSLTEDALFIYTAKKPLVIGHSDLAGFINIQLQRPQVIKVHHDLFFSPQNTEDETGHIDEKLERGLQDIFQSYIPIVIGYGGNDGGFMDVLKRVLYQDKGIYWCITEEEHPKSEIEKLVIDKQGYFIPIKDFDELMVLLGQKIGIGLLDEKIEHLAKERVERYREQVQEVYYKSKEGSDLLPDALDKIIKLEKPNWWIYELQVKKETDPSKIESIYEEGLEKCSDSSELMNNYAVFLQNTKKDYAQAEEYYKKALELDPNDATINRNYAEVLIYHKKDYAQAEEYYKKALELDPDNADINDSYALFLQKTKRDYAQAEKHFQKALELDPDNADINDSYAVFLQKTKKDYVQAEKYYQKALELNPDNATINSHYAMFFAFQKKDYAQAEKYYQKALELESDNATINQYYARFFAFQKRDYAQAEKYYQKALKLDPDDADINSYYALFLTLLKRDYSQAEKYHQKALKLDPDDADINGYYALFLTLLKRDYSQAEKYHQKALKLDPDDADINGNYALFLLQQEYFKLAKTFIDKAFQHIQVYNKDLELELWFYRYACFYQDYPESKSKVESLLQDKVWLPRLLLEGLLETVKLTVQHPEYDQVAELARQISEV